MSSLILKSLRTYVGGYDLTGDTNNGGLDLDHDVQDVTVFQPPGSGGARARACGLEDVSAASSGFWATGVGSVDENAFANFGSTLDEPMSMSSDGAEGSVAYMLRTGRFKYSLFGDVGKPAPFALDFRGTNGQAAVVRSLVTKTKAAVAATGATGTAQQVGATSATQFLYAGLHVFSAGTTITAVIESAPDNTFASPTTRITFGPITAVGGYWGTRVAGAITDQWFRLRVTAITGSFTIAANVGIR